MKYIVQSVKKVKVRLLHFKEKQTNRTVKTVSRITIIDVELLGIKTQPE